MAELENVGKTIGALESQGQKKKYKIVDSTDGDCICKDCGETFTGRITHTAFLNEENKVEHAYIPVPYCPACVTKVAAAFDLKQKREEEERRKLWVQEDRNALIRLSKLPPFTEQKYRFDNFIKRNKSTADALASVMRFVEDRPHHFLTLACETKGVGKSHLLVAASWAWLKKYWRPVVYYETAADLLDDLKSGFHITDPTQKDAFDLKMNLLKNASLLVIDDLGVEKETVWALERFDVIINHRYFHNLATLFATNLDPDVLEHRISSRLLEGEVVVIEKTTDYRPEIARMRQAKMERK